GLLLNSHGHILAELETLALAERLIVLGHQVAGARTAETLEKFIIMDDVTCTDETPHTGTLAVKGPAAPGIVREMTRIELSDLGEHGHTEAVVHTAAGTVPCGVIRRSLFGLPGAEFLIRRDAVSALWELLAGAVQLRGGSPIGYRAINMLRLEAGIPWFGADF